MKKKIHIIFWWSFWIIFLELIYRIFIFNTFFDKHTLSVILFSIPWTIIISFLTTIFTEKINKLLITIFSYAITIITLAQIVYYNFYSSIFSFFSLTNGTGQVMEFWQAILNVMLSIWYIFLIVLIPLILFTIFKSKIFNFKRLSFKISLIPVAIFILSLGGIILLTIKSNEGIYSINRLLLKTHAPLLTASKIGLNSTEALDLYRYIFGFEEEVYIEENEEINIVEQNPEIKYNMKEIDFDKLISKTTNKTLKNMHKYFKNVMPTNQNKYTGLFKEKNLIFITAEAFDAIALDENLTPTLYKMANNGLFSQTIINHYIQYQHQMENI